MADTYEKDLEQKSTLTTSDYIRVVGSDNVSYKQLISAVMEVMSSLTYKKTLTSSDDCNTLEQGVYIFTTSVPQNAPSSVSYGTLIVVNGTYGSSVYNFQLLSTSGRGLYYRRKQGNTSDSFATWARVSRSDELDALSSSNAGHTLGSGATVTITLSKYQCAGTLYGAVGNSLGFAYSFGNGYLAPIKTATGVSVTLGSDYKTITVTNSTSASGRVGMSVTEGATVTMA